MVQSSKSQILRTELNINSCLIHLTISTEREDFEDFEDAECATQKMKFSIKNFLSKCDQIHRKLQICHIY